MDWVYAALLGYLFGSIPFGLLVTRAAGMGDVRQIGSGSIGATNVLRTGRKGLAAATVLLDAGKGVAAVLLAGMLFRDGEFIAAVAAVVGHCFPLWLRFKGGKGFATAAGACLGLALPVFLICAGVWALAIAVSRISSVSSLIAVTAAPVAAWALEMPTVALTLAAVTAIVFVQHRANIARLMRGDEPKIGGKK